MARSLVLSFCVCISTAMLVGCGSTGTITSRLYSLSSDTGKIEYSAPSDCYGPSYWFSAKIHPNVRLGVAERNLGWGPLIAVSLWVGKNTEMRFDGPFEVIDSASSERFELPAYELNMTAGVSPRFDHVAPMFGPGKEPATIQKQLIYEGGGSYSYHSRLPMPVPRRQRLVLKIPAASVGEIRVAPIVVYFEEASITWEKACYDIR